MFIHKFDNLDNIGCLTKESKLADIKVFARATITFDFDLKDIEKVKEIFDLIREDINLRTNLEIDSKVKEAKIEKIGDRC